MTGNKEVVVTINPKWCEKIANGEKTIEVRKNCPRAVSCEAKTKVDFIKSDQLDKNWEEFDS